MSGTLPSSFASINLKKLALQGNTFSGRIPLALFSTNEQLDFINISYNQLDGPILPDVIAGLPMLVELYLDNNRFSEMSNTTLAYFMSHPSLRRLTFHSNRITTKDLFNVNVAGNIATSKMVVLSGFNNYIRGQISNSLVQLKTLKSLFVHDNMLSCPLPQEASALDSSKSNIVLGNAFDGPVPDLLYISDGVRDQKLLFVSDNFFSNLYVLTK